MAKARKSARLILGCLMMLGCGATVEAAPTVAQMLNFRPKQDGIVISTPTAAEQDRCKVELVKAGRTSGWMLKDENGNVLRRYLDTNGDNKIDIWSYYSNGVEVYREIDSNYNDKVDQYRWFHAAGSKWGLDPVEDGKVKTWKVISPEEISQEVLQSAIKKDYARFQALMLTEAELRGLDLPAPEAARIREVMRKAQAKFQETTAKIPVSDKSVWDHVEMALPQCVPAEILGGKLDLVRYTSAILYFQNGDKAGAMQLGEMIQVGSAWRLIDAPVPGDKTSGDQGGLKIDSVLEGFLKELEQLDVNPPKMDKDTPAVIAAHNLKRAEILDKILVHICKPTTENVKPEDKEQWTKQVADCLGVAAQQNTADKTALQRLGVLRERVVKENAGTALAGYVTYVEINADYAVQMAEKPNDGPKIQKEFLEKLAKFVQDYPTAENAPDALSQLGMLNELMGEEEQAKKWYEMFTKNFPNHSQAGKIKGALDRLTLNGKEPELAAPTMAGSQFNIKTLKGKVVVVYYWASWNQQSSADFDKLKDLYTKYSAKGLELVCVNLDNTANEAKAALAGKPNMGVHLYEPGGLASRLSDQYGILVLPTMFVVGKDGKVINRSAQMSTLEDELKKALN